MVPWANKIAPRKIIPGCFNSRAVIKCILSFSASSGEQTIKSMSDFSEVSAGVGKLETT